MESSNTIIDKYQEALVAGAVPTDENTVTEAVKKILDRRQEYATTEVYKFLLGSIDLTTLSTTDSNDSVTTFTQRVNDFESDFPDLPHVAAICVYSNFAEVVRMHLDVTGVETAVVAGGFPSGQTFTAVKIADAALAYGAGASEIDVVMNLGLFLDSNFDELSDELIDLKHTIKDARLKVILETGALKTPEAIKRASILALYSEADFLKTSTGKIYEGATPEAAWVMCRCIKEYFDRTGRKVGFKAAGGIRTTDEALKYYAIVKEVLGDEWLCHDLFRIGASGLANALLSDITGTETKYF